MKYTYLISFSCMLAGCGEPLTLEQVEKAKEYCASKNATIEKSYGMRAYPTPLVVWCKKDDSFYEVSVENMK